MSRAPQPAAAMHPGGGIKHVYPRAVEHSGWVISEPMEGGMKAVTMTAWRFIDDNGDLSRNDDISGPVIDVVAGTTVVVHLKNELSGPVSIHPYGGIYDIENDGSAETGSTVAPGKTRTYTWKPSNDTVGTWLYHDHAVERIARGLFGMIVVRPAISAPVDKEFFLFLGEFLSEFISELGGQIQPGMEMMAGFNGKSFPSNRMLMARPGEIIRFHVASVGTESHTFHLHGRRWKDQDSGRIIDAKQVGPFELTTFTVKAGQTGPGNWLYHCHDLMHLEEGMLGTYTVDPMRLRSAHPDHQEMDSAPAGGRRVAISPCHRGNRMKAGRAEGTSFDSVRWLQQEEPYGCRALKRWPTTWAEAADSPAGEEEASSPPREHRSGIPPRSQTSAPPPESSKHTGPLHFRRRPGLHLPLFDRPRIQGHHDRSPHGQADHARSRAGLHGNNRFPLPHPRTRRHWDAGGLEHHMIREQDEIMLVERLMSQEGLRRELEIRNWRGV